VLLGFLDRHPGAHPVDHRRAEPLLVHADFGESRRRRLPKVGLDDPGEHAETEPVGLLEGLRLRSASPSLVPDPYGLAPVVPAGQLVQLRTPDLVIAGEVNGVVRRGVPPTAGAFRLRVVPRSACHEASLRGVVSYRSM